jgi:hypothetical protein
MGKITGFIEFERININYDAPKNRLNTTNNLLLN